MDHSHANLCNNYLNRSKNVYNVVFYIHYIILYYILHYTILHYITLKYKTVSPLMENFEILSPMNVLRLIVSRILYIMHFPM